MFLAFSTQKTIIITAIALLIIQWPLALYTAMKLFKDATEKRINGKFAIVLWNVLIIFVPIIGPAAYLAVSARRKSSKSPENGGGTDLPPDDRAEADANGVGEPAAAKADKTQNHIDSAQTDNESAETAACKSVQATDNTNAQAADGDNQK